LVPVEGSDTLKLGELRNILAPALALGGIPFLACPDPLESSFLASRTTSPSVAIIASRCSSRQAIPRPISTCSERMPAAQDWRCLLTA
jgi:hypothetical protein